MIVLFHVGLDFFVLFHVGLARLFVGVVLSEFYVGLPFYFLSVGTETMALSSRGFYLFFSKLFGLAQLLVWLSRVFLFGRGRGEVSWARAVSFCQASGSRSFLLGVCFRGPRLALVFLLVWWYKKVFFYRAWQVGCVLRWARASCFWSSALGVLFWTPACCFLFERWRQVKCFV